MFLNTLIGICIIGAVTVPLITGQQLANVCSKLNNGTLVRNVHDCATYFQCVDGQPILQNCPTGQLFNNYTRLCDSDVDNVICFSCPSDTIFSELHVPNECNQFIRCYNGQPEQKTCEDGLRYDRNRKQCNLESEVECPFDFTCPENNADLLFIRDIRTCSKFAVCVGGIAEDYECNTGLYFDTKLEQCAHKENTDCTPLPGGLSNIETMWYKPVWQY